MDKKTSNSISNTKQNIPPVVAVLGHVDHGKTTLLDAIRKTNVVKSEHGGITQKIGASYVETIHEGKKLGITFIDTPGHAAFSKMRGRGADSASIALLVVSAVDGVMPQTKESIQLLKIAKIPFIIVLTKADLPEKNIEKVKQQLLKEDVAIEEYGGNIPMIEVSAKTGQNIKELLDLILLAGIVSNSSIKPEDLPSATKPFEGIIIESKLDQKTGPRATLVVKNGTIAVKDELATEGTTARVRALITDLGQSIKSASVGQAVEILGFENVPAVGNLVYLKKDFKKSIDAQKVAGTKATAEQTVSIILCADTQGSLEAIIQALPKEVHVLLHKTGDISEADVLLAKSTSSLVLTFNIKLRADLVKFAMLEKVLLKNYTIIYELLDEIQEVIKGKQLSMMEQIYGSARCEGIFPFNNSKVMGIEVMDGRIARGDKIRLIRNDDVIGESGVVSLRKGKDTASKVEKGEAGGILISPLLDFQVGDVIIAHS